MRNLVLFMHISLDGFAADKNSQIDWVHVDEEIFEYVNTRIQATDTALYGRKTYEMMQAYWRTAADQPNPSKHDIDHSAWYKKVEKVVLSTTLSDQNLSHTRIINEHVPDEIRRIKQRPGTEILIFGSPSAAHSLMAENLIDEYWLFVNPIILGEGIPVFKDVKDKIPLTLQASKTFTSGVVCLHYQSTRDGR